MRIPHNERLGSDNPKADPERKCILSGEHGLRDALIRLAISPPRDDGTCEVLPDVRARAPGRGAWIGVSRADLETALAKGKLKGALSRAFGKSLGGAPLSIPTDLGERIEQALVRAFSERLGLEYKAGGLLTGSERIAEKARAGRVCWLAHAADASADGSRKLDQALRVGLEEEGSGRAGVTLPLDRTALSVALGRDNVVHLALTNPAAASRIAVALQRLLRFQGRPETAEIAATEIETSGSAVSVAAPLVVTSPEHDRAPTN